eukprot:TRINITY_DN56340_c0_g1_i1.p1 TRINITY_DN56340_c0_g1~~TRINITY_DN56340_c0_g1_i1.p1  ORF type:complete len:352 (+),score=78.23 TRINITY_DN56340_c0_g1_i1:54-1058(+)
MEPATKKTKMSEAPSQPAVTLSNGAEMPLVGFGTAWFFNDGLEGVPRSEETAWRAVTRALELGFRHIDTAHMYGNEEHIGNILGGMMADGRLKRDDVWITTKVCHPQAPIFGLRDPSDGATRHMHVLDMDSEQGLLDQFFGCLKRLKLGHVDLLLVHWPGPYKNGDKELGKKKRREMWTAMERIYKAKLARCIGVSNFMIPHLEEILEFCTVKPMMNQVEIHPYLSQQELQKFCDPHGIRLTAYCPLASGRFGMLKDPVLLDIAKKKNVDIGQVVLRWLAQRGIAVIPKSTSEERQLSNLHCMAKCPELSESEMNAINGLDCGKRACDDPNLIA